MEKLRGGLPVRLVAALLVAAGVVVASYAGWQWFGKVRMVARQQTRLGQALDTRWATLRTPVNLAAGAPIARLHLPSLSVDLVVVEGSADAQLDTGPGHIAGTAEIGAAGNVGIAGHRYPGVFWDLDRLEAGDPVVVETATTWYVYRVRRTVTVEPDDRTVLAAPPAGSPALLTLVTCEPKLSTAHRLVKQAELVRADPREGPRPREMSVRSRR
jgi:sortase A